MDFPDCLLLLLSISVFLLFSFFPVFTLIATVVTYCTEASNQKSKYAYRKIFFYKKSTGYSASRQLEKFS